MPSDPNDPLSKQNLKDRYYGTDDPVAEKLMRQAASMPKLSPPEDRTITTLYIGGLADVVQESDLRYVQLLVGSPSLSPSLSVCLCMSVCLSVCLLFCYSLSAWCVYFAIFK